MYIIPFKKIKTCKTLRMVLSGQWDYRKYLRILFSKYVFIFRKKIKEIMGKSLTEKEKKIFKISLNHHLTVIFLAGFTFHFAKLYFVTFQ